MTAMDRAVALTVAAVQELTGGRPVGEVARALELEALKEQRAALVRELAAIDDAILTREVVTGHDLSSSDPLWQRRYRRRRQLTAVNAGLPE